MRINKNLLKKTAMKSNRMQKHSSFIFKNGNLVSIGYNNEFSHAEEKAINSYYSDVIMKGYTMVNLRLTRSGRIGMAKPCPACFALLKEKKFRKIIYSTNEGTFQEIYL